MPAVHAQQVGLFSVTHYIAALSRFFHSSRQRHLPSISSSWYSHLYWPM